MFLKILIKQDKRGAESNSLGDYSNLDNAVCSLRLWRSQLACVASVSLQFRSKERGTRVKDRAKNSLRKKSGEGVSFLPLPLPPPPFIFWFLFHFSRGQNRESLSSVFLCSETKGKRLLRRLVHSIPDSFAPPEKSYRIGFLFTRKNGCSGAISVTQWSCA